MNFLKNTLLYKDLISLQIVNRKCNTLNFSALQCYLYTHPLLNCISKFFKQYCFLIKLQTAGEQNLEYKVSSNLCFYRIRGFGALWFIIEALKHSLSENILKQNNDPCYNVFFLIFIGLHV